MDGFGRRDSESFLDSEDLGKIEIKDVLEFLPHNHSIDVEDEQYEDHNSWESSGDPWFEMDLPEKWKDTIQKLLHDEIRWDAEDTHSDDEGRQDEFSPKPAVLDPRKKVSLTYVDHKYGSEPTVLHRLAHGFDDDGFNDLVKRRPETAVKIVNYLLQERNSDSQHTSDEDPILKRAIEHQNLEFIKFVSDRCTNHLPDLLDSQDIRGANCLHFLFRHHLFRAASEWRRALKAKSTGKKFKEMPLNLHETMLSLWAFAIHSRPSTIIARDELGNTPIHYAMDYRICRLRLGKVYHTIVLALVRKGDKAEIGVEQLLNDNKESPYLYSERTQDTFLANLRKETERRSASAPFPSGTKAVSGHSKITKQEIRDPRPATPENVGRNLDAYSKVPIVKDIRILNPREAIMVGGTDMAVPTDTPSVGGREDTKERKILDASEPGLFTGPPGHGFSRARTGDSFQGRTNPKGPPNSHATSVNLKAMESVVASVNENASSPSKSGATGPPTKFRQDIKTNAERQIAQTQASPVWEEPADLREAAEHMRYRLKLHYIRTHSDMNAKILLYGRVASDRNLYLDATHLKTSRDVVDLVAMLASPGGLGDTLSFVKLPVLGNTTEKLAESNSSAKMYDANERRRRDSGGNENKMTGRSSVVAVFDKLAQAGVVRILRLIVEEDTQSPHTDSAIERAIRGFDSISLENKRKEGPLAVEIWDWKKFDLSIDVITLAAPAVNEVNLYWSGNWTVLRGWASDEGIPRLYQQSSAEENAYGLKTVNVHWTSGFEGYERCAYLLEDFTKLVQQRTREMHTKGEGSGVTVNTMPLKGSKAGKFTADNYLESFTAVGLNSRAPPDHGWIESMEKFRLVLMMMHNDLPKHLKPEAIKVALIDDGIEYTQFKDYAKRVEVTGMSYWSSSAIGVVQNPSWHQSTRGHGTVMANSITRVNPWVSLYVMRIQDEVDRTGIRIHAASAASAIEDAIIRKVNIISISWTINNITKKDESTLRSSEVKAIHALKNSIGNARDHGILIFCSASDDIQKRSQDTLPYSEVPGYAFRIGAADAFGWGDRATEDHKAIDWFFPGNQVADDSNPRDPQTNKPEHRDGSSIATSLAAGLASLILYLTNVMKARHNDNSNATRYEKLKTELQSREGLKKAFDNIVTKDENYMDKKFLPVWSLFGAKAKTIGSRGKDDWVTKWEDLTELCNSLYSDLL